MSKPRDFLVEIGTEEMPPKALRGLMEAFGDNLTSAVDHARLSHADTHVYASPRRLTVLIERLAAAQDDRRVEQKGPPVKVAFDDDGNPTPAATSFATKCGVAIEELDRVATDKGEWLVFNTTEEGRSAAELLPEMVERALTALPIPRRMRWGAGEAEFVRPIHWVVLLHGEDVVDGEVMGIRAGRESRGHRFHVRAPIVIDRPGDYLGALEKDGYVIADFERRRELVREGVEDAAEHVGGHVVDGEALYDEVASLVEWPVPIVGAFDEHYLELPREAVVSTLTGHQRYFPVADADGRLLPHFITVANLESKDPEQVIEGNERVIRPRLADAAFFWDSDRRTTLASREEALRDVVYQAGLGSLFDKSRRVGRLAAWLADEHGINKQLVERAAALAKCDLLTGMVGEFPELQGLMGRYYALADGEPDAVADAIAEHYLPRFAGDELPDSAPGQVLSIADRLDTLAGVFSIGKKPTGNRDPFGLRRAALGIVRILIEQGLDVDLKAMIANAVAAQPKGKVEAAELADDLYGFITERLRRYFLDRDAGLTIEAFEAVMLRRPSSLVDFDRRLAAVQTFARLEQAESLAAANKRIANILRKAGDPDGLEVRTKRFELDAEKALHNALLGARDKVGPLLEQRRYAEVLNELADLRDPVDHFFDEVMVMTDDEAVRDNRLALLGELRALFLDVADISRLSIA
ncbi:MAG: glycine--tRNA ligase subunit beta [Gammaproteobacteria bacterium]|nr:glycine--tRNA ligase subunit beta [Gammaproteobacteria bacterium]